jgi:hypothetical protein
LLFCEQQVSGAILDSEGFEPSSLNQVTAAKSLGEGASPMRLIRLVLVLAAVLLSNAATAQWRKAESPHFVVYSTNSEAKLRERTLLLEDFDRLLRIWWRGTTSRR